MTKKDYKLIQDAITESEKVVHAKMLNGIIKESDYLLIVRGIQNVASEITNRLN